MNVRTKVPVDCYGLIPFKIMCAEVAMIDIRIRMVPPVLIWNITEIVWRISTVRIIGKEILKAIMMAYEAILSDDIIITFI